MFPSPRIEVSPAQSPSVHFEFQATHCNLNRVPLQFTAAYGSCNGESAGL